MTVVHVVRPALAGVVLLVTAACGSVTSPGDADAGAAARPAVPPPPSSDVVRVVFGGDVMLGRNLAAVVAADPHSVFERVRHVLARADLTLANLESPFGESRGDDPLRLVADPAAADVLARAGFDAMNLANNHAGDAGPGSVAHTVATLADRGLLALGIVDADGSATPVVVERSGVRFALLAFDLTRQSPADDVVHWDREVAAEAIAAAKGVADVVMVSLHGGVEYLPAPDPALRAIVDWVAGEGVDVVWAHGAHLPYDVVISVPEGDGRPALLAYGLGNLLFDQRIPGTEEGLLLEVLADADGIRAFRVGEVEHADLRLSAPTWRLPEGDAVLLDGEWWELVVGGFSLPSAALPDAGLAHLGDVSASGVGDVDGDGRDEVVAAFMRPARPTIVNQRFPEVQWVDTAGYSAHLGVYEANTLRPEWVAGSVPHPVVDLAVCDGAVALTHRLIDGDVVIGGGAWSWRDFGFAAAATLSGRAQPACMDVDADGRLEAVLIRGRGE